MKMQIRRRLGTTYMFLSALVVFAVSACATYSNAADLNLTYIGQAIGPNANITYFLQGSGGGETVVLLPGLGRGADEFGELAAALNKAGYRT
ncbi:MAG: hypothetical protein K9K66_19350, partial [Desulfarculaceae bacterium]|nr:hypothetical protein [Desulfarculaceae bacterium]MCF8074540.1 hypothetical protein [Desulfarculaceae bacterium]MCF8103814.1 hypothetical protein [Desulfarculaceae bacterium]MCF8117822.1 hypothetical protein [Desulfarculaceae bacterium]